MLSNDGLIIENMDPSHIPVALHTAVFQPDWLEYLG